MSLDSPCKQRSCTAVTTPSACVNKAIHHIQDLEMKMEASFQQVLHVCRSLMPTVNYLTLLWNNASQEVQAIEAVFVVVGIFHLFQRALKLLSIIIQLSCFLYNDDDIEGVCFFLYVYFKQGRTVLQNLIMALLCSFL